MKQKTNSVNFFPLGRFPNFYHKMKEKLRVKFTSPKMLQKIFFLGFSLYIRKDRRSDTEG
jgi:hypothetical protein